MKKLIIVFLLLVFPVVGLCSDQVYLGNDPTPHAKWVRERDNYTIIYSLKNLLERDEAKRKAAIEEAKKQLMMEKQRSKEKIQL